jgi:hemoglobin
MNRPTTPTLVRRLTRTALLLAALAPAGLSIACASGEEERSDEFFTSGSREADQRAEQRMARTEQLRGGEEGAGGGDKQDDAAANAKKTLYERLGGERGMSAIVDDWIPRALADPRVNWERKGVESGGVLGIGERSVEWQATPDNVARLKKHMAQFLAVATGGPPTYEGADLKQSHANMRISNAQFDAAVGDLKATLDKLGVPADEQKELLSIIESTRPQIAAER